ncbi:MAG TPA: thioredoxin, partial [Thermoanaerobaculia bacterium]|nr:thioredoxin [Thermoanaerobaculia bacterium]
TNRVPLEKVARGLTPVCGRCRTRMPIDLEPVTVTDATFASEVERWPLPVLVDLWAAWCGPCRMIAPVLEQLARERTDVTFAKLNVDENPRTAAQFGVQSIPLLVFFRNGSEAGRVVGAVPRPQIEAAIQRYLG